MSSLPVPEYDRPVRTEYKLLAALRAQPGAPSLREVADRLGYSYSAVLQWTKRPDYQRYESWLINQQFIELAPEGKKLREVISDQFSEYAQYMQERLLAILDSTHNERLQKEIAQDWLDRAGHGPIRRSDGRSIQLVLTPELVQQLRDRAAEAQLEPVTVGNPVEQSPDGAV
jgi:DNA-binding MarR family transcriptional regulator